MPTPRQESKQAIESERHSGDRYSVESMRANMATGGGEPIPKGQKRTDQRRVLQPRDPDTGEFEFNSSANYGRKYPDRSKPEHWPVAARGWMLPDGIKKGDKVNIGERTWIAIDDIDEGTMRDYFKNFDEESGDFVSGGQRLSDKFVRKQGRQSKSEKEGIEAGERVVGAVDMDKLGSKTKEQIKAKMDKILRGGQKPSEVFSLSLGIIEAKPLDKDKLEENRRYNERMAKEENREQPMEQPQKRELAIGGKPEPNAQKKEERIVDYGSLVQHGGDEDKASVKNELEDLFK